MNKKVLDFVNKCEGFKSAVKEFHWDSRNLSQHKLCDDIAERIADFQDQVSEVEQSITGKLPLGKLKPTPYKTETLKKFVEDVIDDTNAFYKEVKKMGDKYIGMSSDCESFMSDMQRLLYLVNFTIKEDFKRNYHKKVLAERKMQNNNLVRLNESEFFNLIHESVRKVMNEACCEAEVQGGQYHDQELNYTHFAVNKDTHLIVDGWDYSGYDTEDLKNKNEYFFNDLRDNGFNPNQYKILTFNGCRKAGLDPNDSVNWSNTGVFPLFHEQYMKKNGENFLKIAQERHPDWFVE